MNHFKDQFFSNFQKPILWLRFIDDIFGIWDSDHCFNNFISNLNNQHKSIQFTCENPSNSVNFLDITIYVNDHNILNFKPYFKPNHNFNILPKHSSHPPHIFKNIIKNEIRRLAFNSCNKIDFLTIFNKVKKFWIANGYTKTSIRNAKNYILNNYNLINNWQFGSFSCNSCSICKYHKKSFSYKSFRILGNFNCQSNNTIYVLQCSNCNKSIYWPNK